MTKVITEQQLNTVIEAIVKEQESRAKSLGQTFNGVTESDIFTELGKRIGTGWVVRKESPIKFSKEDINYVANGRFYKKTGQKILMLAGILALALVNMMRWLPMLPDAVYYGLFLVSAVALIYAYGKKQRQARKELWDGIEGDGQEPHT